MTKEQIYEELKKIQASIPRSYFKGLFRKKKLTPTVKKVAEYALKDDSISDAKKEQLKDLLDSGELDMTEEVENKKAIERINRWVERKIDEAIKKGLLPSRDKLKQYANEKRTSK